MTEQEVAELGPAWRGYLADFRRHLGHGPVRQHIATYCRGLASDLPRKSVEPIALAAGATVRSLQLLLTQHDWDNDGLIDALQRRIVERHLPAPGEERLDPIGVVGWIDETSVAKKGEKTPGVQRQYCGSTGKIDNCIITVHLAVGYGPFSAILDSGLYVPQGWTADRRDRCRAAGIPEDLPFRTKPQIALAQVQRAVGNGLRFDWVGFDEGYGKPPFLLGLEQLGVTFIGEVAANFRCFSAPPRYRSLQRPYVAKEVQHLVRGGAHFKGRDWTTFRVRHKTVGDSAWQARAGRVHISVAGACHDQAYWLIVARNRQTQAVKYFISNAPPRTSLKRMLAAAFSRWGIEHLFRLAKSEIGLGHYEGRKYLGLMRHMALCQLTLLFIAEQTQRLRGEKPAVDEGAGGAGVERDLRPVAAA